MPLGKLVWKGADDWYSAAGRSLIRLFSGALFLGYQGSFLRLPGLFCRTYRDASVAGIVAFDAGLDGEGDLKTINLRH